MSSHFSVEPTGLPGLQVVHFPAFTDARGDFVKFYHEDVYRELLPHFHIAEQYFSNSRQGVVRGLHFQAPPFHHHKLVSCIAGSILDAVLDLRRGSPTFRNALTFVLREEERLGLLLPPGCAHGFCTTSPNSTLLYSTSGVHNPAHDSGILWNSAGIDWPALEPTVSERDRCFPPLESFVTPFEYGVPPL